MSGTPAPVPAAWETDARRQLVYCILWAGTATLIMGQAGLAVFVALILHETGHYVTARLSKLQTYGIACKPAGMAVRIYATYTPALTARLAIAGPLAGVVFASGGLIVAQHTHSDWWATGAYIGAAVNLLVLLPVGETDGVRIVTGLVYTNPISRYSRLAAIILYLIALGAIVGMVPLVGIGFGLVVLIAGVGHRFPSRSFEVLLPMTHAQRVGYGGLYLLTAVTAAVVMHQSTSTGGDLAMIRLVANHWHSIWQLAGH